MGCGSSKRLRPTFAVATVKIKNVEDEYKINVTNEAMVAPLVPSFPINEDQLHLPKNSSDVNSMYKPTRNDPFGLESQHKCISVKKVPSFPINEDQLHLPKNSSDVNSMYRPTRNDPLGLESRHKCISVKKVPSFPINEDQLHLPKNSSDVNIMYRPTRNDPLGLESQHKCILVRESTESANESNSSVGSLTLHDRPDFAPRDDRPGSASREAFATSRKSIDSGVCDYEDNKPLNMITGEYNGGRFVFDLRQDTAGLSVQRNNITCEKLRKNPSVESDNTTPCYCRNNTSTINRPLSPRIGNVAHIVLCPETANVRRKPENLPPIEMKNSERRKKRKKKTPEEIEEKQRKVAERRKLRECPETANIRRKPELLAELEMKSSEREKIKKKKTLKEIEEKQRKVAGRRKLREEQKQ